MAETEETRPHYHYHSRALDRGLTILTCLARSRTGAEGLAGLHALTGLPKSTLLRLLAVLEARGFVRAIAGGEAYRLGHAVVDLAESYRRGADLPAAAAPHLAELVARTGQTANLGVLEDGMVLHVLVREPERALRFRSVSGSRDAVHCTGLGKMLLAGRAEAEVRELLARGPLERRTARTLTDPGDVLAEVARTRARGHAIDDEEGALGVCCLAVPVVTDPADGRWAASISLSGPVGEMAGADRERLLAALDHTARAMAADDELAAALATSPWC